ncbi:uncharacterized protein LOC123868524 [Maniola jurtina]|uniref:uncharacterized protein LOC123868524 n=1 Tax=Maniola jurtina TaxID=191418 RepID=UPI001E6865C3|nr:uncharacterized protein LOC123868524 [Maniola jurtina]
MEELVAFQNELLENLRRSDKNFRKSPKDRLRRAYLESRLEILEQLWKEFTEGHKEIIYKASGLDKTVTVSYLKDNTYELFEDLYLQYKTTLKETLQSYILETNTTQTLPPTTEKSINEVKLPVIQLPIFNGKYEEWQTFYDLFCSLIHENKRLSPVQKLHYLKSNLKGEPELMLRNLPTTDANYQEAWSQLVKRYNNKRYNCNAILKILFGQKPISMESASAIKNLVDTTSMCIKALENTGVMTESWDLFINYLVVSKLDTESVKQWEQNLSKEDDQLPTWLQLKDFLEARFRSLEMIESSKAAKRFTPPAKPKAFHTSVDKEGVKSEVKCAFCNINDHYIFKCKRFCEMPTKERQDFVQKSRLCFNCLSSSHSVSRCKSTANCRRCFKRHHSLIHFEKEDKEQKDENSKEDETTSTGTMSEVQKGKTNALSNLNDSQIVSNFSSKHIPNNVLLATANVFVRTKNGCKRVVRVLLDQGSQASFISESTVQFLNLTRKPVSGWVSGVGEGQMRIKHMVSLIVESRHNPRASVRVNAYVLRSLTTLLPTTNLSAPEWSDLENLELADPGYTTPGRIDILLGAEVYSDILLDGILKHPQENLLAQKTILGWVLSGKMSRESTSARRNITSLHINVKEDEILKQFWEMENEPNSIVKNLSKEEERCEEYYNSTTVRDEDGRYIVKLPFKNEEPECQYGNSREIASKRLEILERKLKKNEKLKEEYTKVMDEYINLNHMTEVDAKEVGNPKAVYLPHHAVLREDKTTSKVRVVYDASCKDGINGVSLNDCLLVGPKLQQDLRHILMRWRTHKVCLAADIVKMYRMIRVAEEDTNFQRLLWRCSPDKPVTHFRLLRLTFGTACAPYLAVKTLQRLAEDEKTKFPIAAEITKRDYYMDDLLTGCDSVEEAFQIYEEMNKLMTLGGFQLQKWCSNDDTLLSYIGQNKRDDDLITIKANNSLVKILAVSWNRTTDSMIVLAWLKAGPSRWNTFVSNRVSDILNILDYEQWGHVSTDTNPADCASRGYNAMDLSSHELWWNGPTWLLTLDTNRNISEIEDTHEEEKVSLLIALSHTEEDLIWNKYSSLSRMLRIMSYCRRFLNLKLSKDKRKTFSTVVTPKEMNETLNNCIKQVQAIAFNEEIKQLTSQGYVPKRSQLRKLCPILDQNGILRVGGRIQKSQVDYDVRHLIILPAKSHLSRLIIVDAHQRTMHGGPQLIMSYLRSKYWILRAKVQAKKTYRECVTCIRHSKRNVTPLMGQLPEARLKPSKPFKSAGVDYAGPINIRFSPGRGSKSYKGYICLFVCFVTRAIHLEAVTDMTTQGFLQAFRRFTARKGHCQDLHSDNGTNLVGASRQLKEMFNNAKSTFPREIAELLAQERTTWHFNPPYAKNFGGLWEAGVRSTKTHLLKVIGDTTLTYEELSTVLAQVEACLNSRPITLLSDDPEDPLPLTPGHFLIGEPLINIPDENYTQCKISNLDRWRLTQKMVADFWNRWYKEYLVNLNLRYKWNTKTPDPEIDDIVILKEDHMPPCKWLLGRIIQKHVGPDNITRVVTVKCKNGVYKRPVNRICRITKQDGDS